jgi:hypothetical protein
MQTSDDVIVAEGLTKSYGASRGVIDLTFRVRAGDLEIVRGMSSRMSRRIWRALRPRR